MKILMLGNSFIFYNDLPKTLASLTGADVVQHTRGGAWLAEQLNEKTQMGAATQAALRDEKWDYVILQEMSNGPVTARESFFASVEGLCAQISANGAVPVLYATWAYERGSAKMASMDMPYEEMYEQLRAAYHEAGARYGALVADVGRAFYKRADQAHLYADDGTHPNEAGSRIAAEVLAEVILADAAERNVGEITESAE